MAKAKTRTVYRYKKANPHRSKKRFTLPIAVLLGFAPSISYAWSNFRSTGLEEGVRVFARSFTGYDPASGVWNWAHLNTGLFPVLMGLAVHKFVGGMLGVNRTLGSAGVPIIRL